MDKLSAMQAFCRIVERGSFARAAEDLRVSPALLSREVRLLEESLGTTLITRTTRRMALTEAGRHYYDEAMAILDAVNRVEDQIRERAGAVAGHLRINAPSSFGHLVVAPLLPGFFRRYPDLRVSLTLDDRVVDMVEGGFDLTIRIRSSLKDSSFRARRIGRVRVGLYAAPSYLAVRGTPASTADLAGHDLVGYLLSEHLTSWDLQGNPAQIIPVDPKIRVSSSFVLRDLLVAGCGIGTLPDFLAQAAEAAGSLQRVLPAYELPSRDIWAVSAMNMARDVRISAFLDHLQQALANELPPLA